MATIKELQEKIAKLEKGINSKATSSTAKAKMRTQVKNFKSDIADLKAKSKPTSSKVSKAKEISKEMKRKYSKSRPFGKSNIYQDAVRPAKPIGRRTSAEGNTYYEYRENRTDRKQPPRKYPRLEDGGIMAKGGTTNENLIKELNKLQRELNSRRLQTYMEGDTSEQEMARQRERASKMARFNEILRLLNENESKMAKGGMTYSEIKSQYLENEDENAHSENVVLLAKHFGTESELKEAKRILQLHDKEGYLSSENGKKRQELHLKLIAKARKEMNKEGIKFADGGMLNLLADTSGAGLQNVGGSSFSNVDLTSHMDLTNPMFANGGELHRSQDSMYAKGGMTEHGLKRGDEIIDDQFWDNSIVVRNRKDGTQAIVYLSTGKRKESKM
jgi:hypothetical protein